MDNLTHTLIGVGLARAGISQRLGRGATLILAVASNLPDIDVACLAGGPLTFLWRRTPTHSLVGALLLAVAATILFRRFYPHLSRRTIFSLSLLGIGGHIFADLWNSYGVVVFWPFNWRRVGFDWVFIIDLAIWGILGVSLIAALAWRRREQGIWRAGLVLLVLYVGTCAFARSESGRLLLQETASAGLHPEAIHLYPEPYGPERFRGVAVAAGRYEVYDIRAFQKTIRFLESVEAAEKSPVVEAARRSEPGRRLDWFFQTPVWTVSPDGQAALVHGLRFRTRALRSRNPFVFRITPAGEVSRVRQE